MNTFESCCEYLEIPTDLPKCYIRERQHQAAYKLSVCMAAWNKQDEFESDEKKLLTSKSEGFDDKLITTPLALDSATVGVLISECTDEKMLANAGLSICLVSRKRAVELGETFVETFNELI